MENKVIQGFPATSNNDYQLNLITLLRHAARTFPEVEIASRKINGEIFRYNYGQAYERVKKLANVLESLGVKPGDRIGALDWNTYRYNELYFAISGIGAVLVQINPRISGEERSYVINHSNARFIFADETLLSVIEPVAANLESVEGFIVLTDKNLDEVNTNLAPLYSYENLLSKASADYEWPVIDENSAYSACYTSGTTGKPKGVYYSHRNIYLHTMSLANTVNLSQNDVVMQIVPMFHAQGWGLFFSAVMTGAKLVFPGMYSAEKPASLVQLLVEEKVTASCGAPAIFMPMLEYMKNLPEKPDLTGLRMLCGASEPPKAMMKEYWELMGAEIIHAYGSTETTPLVTANILKPALLDLPGEEKWELRKKQGLPVTGIDIKVVDDDGKDVPCDGITMGELLIKGPWITRSYYNDPRSEEAFVDGYWRSGDAATIDAYGYVKITDRFKDLVKSGGEWISSIDVENEIMSHPGVLEAVVVGLPHPKWEERPLALVVPRENYKEKITKEDVIEHISSRFAKWQLPDDVLFIDEISKTSVGKFSKRRIREQYYDYYQK